MPQELLRQSSIWHIVKTCITGNQKISPPHQIQLHTQQLIHELDRQYLNQQ